MIAAVEAGRPVASEGPPPPRDLRDAADGLPETPVGKRASAYFDTFDRGDAEAFERFTRLHRTPASLSGATMEARLEEFRRNRRKWGRLRPVRYALVASGELFVLVQSEIGELVFGFTVEAEPPHRLASISLSY